MVLVCLLVYDIDLSHYQVYHVFFCSVICFVVHTEGVLMLRDASYILAGLGRLCDVVATSYEQLVVVWVESTLSDQQYLSSVMTRFDP